MRLTSLTAALLCSTLPVAAVEPPMPPGPPPAIVAARAALADVLRAELATDDPRRQAWAAYEIGARGLDGERSALLALAVAPDADAAAVRRRASVVDALVRLPGTTPAALVAALATVPTLRNQALILAAREPDAHRGALESLIDSKLDDVTWLGACQALTTVRTPRLAVHLAGALHLRLQVQVHDAGRVGGGRRRIVAMTDGTIAVEPGWPPFAWYRLATSQHDPGSVLLNDGYCAVYWTRREIATSGGVGGRTYPIDRDAARIELLRRLASPRNLVPLEAATRVDVVWTGLDAYHERIAVERARLAEARRALLAPLVEQGLLPVDAATNISEAIDVTVTDRRSVQDPPLPGAVSATAPSVAPDPEF